MIGYDDDDGYFGALHSCFECDTHNQFVELCPSEEWNRKQIMDKVQCWNCSKSKLKITGKIIKYSYEDLLKMDIAGNQSGQKEDWSS